MSAYEELLKQLEKEGGEKENKKNQKHSEVVKKVSSENSAEIIRKITELKIQVNESLENLGKDLLNERSKLSDLQEAIDIEEARIKNTHEISVNANSLEALLLAQKNKKEDFENWIEAEKEKFRSEVSEKKASWAKEQKEYEHTQQEKIEAQKKSWKREEEEYAYKQKIMKQRSEDEYKLKKQDLDRELENRKKTMEEEFKLREESIAVHEQELADLRKLNSEFEKVLQENIDSTKKQITAELEQKYKFASELKQKETEGENSLLKQNIVFLKEKLEEKNKVIDTFSQQLGVSQSQAQELAKKVIESNSRRETESSKEAQNLQEVANKG